MTTIKLQHTGEDGFIPWQMTDREIMRNNWKPGDVVTFETERQRSSKHTRWLFAVIKKAWENLPEDLAHRYPNSEVLRANILIRAGHCLSMDLALKDESEATNLAMVLRQFEKMSRGDSGYAVITQSDNCLTVYTAKSIKFKRKDESGLSQDEFRPIAEKAIHELSVILGVDPVTLLDEVDNIPNWIKEADWKEWAA